LPPPIPAPSAAEDSAPIRQARTFADAARFRDAMARLAGGVAIAAGLDRRPALRPVDPVG